MLIRCSLRLTRRLAVHAYVQHGVIPPRTERSKVVDPARKLSTRILLFVVGCHY